MSDKTKAVRVFISLSRNPILRDLLLEADAQEKPERCFLLQVYSSGYARGLYLSPEHARLLKEILEPIWNEANK